MPNWFEDHPARSIIAYTILVGATVWAISTFILKDNRLNLAQSELAAQKSLTEQYKAKTDLLQRDIEIVRAENAEYRTWLGQTKDAIPSIVPRITELKQKIATLEAEVEHAHEQQQSASPNIEPPKDFHTSIGRAFIDDNTGLIFTVQSTYPNSTAKIAVQFPGTETPEFATISPGKQWKFRFKDKEYLVTVTEISFFGDSVGFRITPQ